MQDNKNIQIHNLGNPKATYAARLIAVTIGMLLPHITSFGDNSFQR